VLIAIGCCAHIHRRHCAFPKRWQMHVLFCSCTKQQCGCVCTRLSCVCTQQVVKPVQGSSVDVCTLICLASVRNKLSSLFKAVVWMCAHASVLRLYATSCRACSRQQCGCVHTHLSCIFTQRVVEPWHDDQHYQITIFHLNHSEENGPCYLTRQLVL